MLHKHKHHHQQQHSILYPYPTQWLSPRISNSPCQKQLLAIMQWLFLCYLLLAGTCQSLSRFTKCTSAKHHLSMSLAAIPSASLSYKRSAIEVSDHGFEENAMLGSEKLLYMDDDIVVIDKAFYSRTVPSQHVSDSAAVTVMQTLGMDRVDQLIVHRLDYATSGIVLFARNLNALRYLHRLFRTGHSIQKRYKAIVSGVPSSFEGEIDLPLGKDFEKGSPFCKVDVTERGKDSLTHWRLAAVAADRRHAMLDLFPKTGRYVSLLSEKQCIHHISYYSM